MIFHGGGRGCRPTFAATSQRVDDTGCDLSVWSPNHVFDPHRRKRRAGSDSGVTLVVSRGA